MVTLEICDTEISIMEVDKGKVLRWAKQLLEPGVMDGEDVADPQALGVAIRRLMESSGIKTTEVVCSVSGLYSLSRLALVSIPPGGMLTYQTVLEAAYEVMPIAEEDVYLSWHNIGSVEGGQQLQIVSIPRDVIDTQMQALKYAGIKSRVLDLKAMAVIRAVNQPQAIIMNVEPNSYDIVLVVNGIAEVMSTSAWVSSELSKEEQAEHLTLNLELTIEFYNSQHRNIALEPSTPMFITGPMSEDTELLDLIKQREIYDITQFFPPLECPPNLPISRYAVSLGLALKGVNTGIENPELGIRSLPDFNLLPSQYKPWRPSARQAYAAFAIVAVIGLLFPVYQFTMAAMDKTAQLEAELGHFNTLLNIRRETLAKREPLQDTIDAYYAVFSADDEVTADLQVIRDEAAKLDVTITALSHTVRQISISCSADSYTVFRQYKTALEESGRFSTPIVPPEGYPYIKSGNIQVSPIQR